MRGLYQVSLLEGGKFIIVTKESSQKMLYGRSALLLLNNDLGLSGATIYNMFFSVDPPQLVAKGVYIGSYLSAQNDIALTDMGITGIINMSCRDYKTRLVRLDLNMDDTDINAEIAPYMMNQFSKGIRVLLKRKGPVLVHCAAGINRSATLIALYLISIGWRPDDAVAALEEANKRRGVPLLTNQSFRRLIYAYHRELTK